MSFITSVFLIIVGFFLWRGYQKGLMASLAQILSLAIAYPAAIFFTTPLANFIFSHSSLSGMLVYFAAGSAIFFIVGLLVTSAIKLAARAFPQSEFTAKGSRVGGALIGVLVGGTIGLIAVYAIGLAQPPASPMAAASDMTRVDDALTTHPAVSTKPRAARAQEKSASDSFIESSAKKLISTAASTAVEFALQDKTATHITKAFTQNPQKMLGHIQNLSNDGELKMLMSDPDIQRLLKQGDTQALLNNWQFQHLMNNQDMQAILVDSEDTKTGKVSQQVAAEKMVEAWQHSDAIKNDPRVVAIITDSEFQQQLNSPNKLALMMNPKLKQLTDIIFSHDYQLADNRQPEDIAPQPQAVNADLSEQAVPQEKASAEEKPKMYHWRDSSGKLHFSDKPAKE